MTLLPRVREFIQQHDLFHQKDKLLLAVSGGVDSVVLCELCKLAGYNFSIAHCNFRLRDKESERDAAFVTGLAKKYDVPFFLKEFDTEKYAEEKKLSIQEAARELRYEWFKELVTSDSPLLTCAYVLTAHHADDNIETLLMNFSRGTGLPGLAGIPLTSPQAKLRRPLLSFWKEELIAFAKENKLEFVEDSSNRSSKYTRNFFRNEIIPMIEKVYPQVKENLRDNINRFKEIGKLYTIAVTEFKKKFLKNKNDEIHIPVKQLMSLQNRALIFEIISGFGFTEKHVDELVKLADSESGKFIQSPTSPTRIIKFRNWFIVSTNKNSEAETVIIEEGTNQLEGGPGNLKIEILPNVRFKIPASTNIACLDAAEIKFPLILRKWKEGDYFYPLGMRKKKKLARFFIDQKLSKTGKEKIWVLEMNKKILWVVNWRIDDRFKISANTKDVLKISLETS
jgi:tRNA(Ile)-lysidine synthase